MDAPPNRSCETRQRSEKYQNELQQFGTKHPNDSDFDAQKSNRETPLEPKSIREIQRSPCHPIQKKVKDFINPNATRANQTPKSKPSQKPLDHNLKTDTASPKCYPSKNPTRKQDAKNANGTKSKQQSNHPKKPPINVEITRPSNHRKPK
jgi:hypothetical protein